MAAFGALFGAVIGSFVATWVMRAGVGRPVTGRSACDGCGRTLAPWELVPLLSWLTQAGRCRYCGQRIDPLHPLTEALAGLIGAVCLWMAPDAGGAALMLFGLLLLTLALFDARYFWLPHRLSAATAVVGLICGGWAMAAFGLDVSLADRLIGCVAGFAVFWLIGEAYQRLRGRQGLGGGDAPMFGAMGAWLGWAALPLLLLFAALAGLTVAAVRLAQPKGSDDINWRSMRLPLGTLLALAAPPALWLLVANSG